MRLDESSLHKTLQTHQLDVANQHMRDLFAADPERAERYTLDAAGLTLDYSKNRINDKTLELLLRLAKEAKLGDRIEALFSGEAVNHTEQRPALHTALRARHQVELIVEGHNILGEVRETLSRMRKWVRAIHTGELRGYSNKPIDTLVSIGIGGSFLGPKTVSTALQTQAKDGLNCHYVANIDGNDLALVLEQIDPETTVFLIQSKSFTTLETLENAKAAKRWQQAQGVPESAFAKHWIAVSANVAAAEAFGIDKHHVFPMWDWVGGRYSLWSAIGLPIAFMVGMDHFEALLDGAHAMDEHFRHAPFEKNMPVLLALLGVWYGNYFGAQSHAVLPYDELMRHLPEHLQQLDMESNGKSVDREGRPLSYPSGPVIWGGPGSNGQHAYHQLLHQGTQLIPADFIMPLRHHHGLESHHRYLFSNCLSQSQALMQGKTYAEALRELKATGMAEAQAAQLAPHKVIAGNKPSNTILMEQVSPASLGALIALYEHKVFAQGVLWNVNSFDQWGVELGKALSKELFEVLEGTRDAAAMDSSTRSLLSRYPL